MIPGELGPQKLKQSPLGAKPELVPETVTKHSDKVYEVPMRKTEKLPASAQTVGLAAVADAVYDSRY